MDLLAHRDADGNVQTLHGHLHSAGDLSESYESKFSQISRMAALLHDVGKIAQQFQTYLVSGNGRRGEIPHARQGAFVVNDLPISNEAEEVAKEILELVIAKHHGELPDCINEIGDEAFLTGFTESDKLNPKYAYREIKQGLHELDLDLQGVFRQAVKDVRDFAEQINSMRLSRDSLHFYSGLLVKYVYSRLIDADRTDTACFETKEKYHPIRADWLELICRLDENMKSFDSTSEINKIRQQITEQCRQAGSRKTGIYRLSVRRRQDVGFVEFRTTSCFENREKANHLCDSVLVHYIADRGDIPEYARSGCRQQYCAGTLFHCRSAEFQ